VGTLSGVRSRSRGLGTRAGPPRGGVRPDDSGNGHLHRPALVRSRAAPRTGVRHRVFSSKIFVTSLAGTRYPEPTSLRPDLFPGVPGASRAAVEPRSNS